MTHPLPGSGPRPAARRAGAVGLLRRGLVGLVAAALIATLGPTLGAGALTPATALTPSSAATPSPSPTAEPPEPELVLAPLARGIAQVGEPLTASLVIDNPTDDTRPASGATLEIADEPFATTAALDDWLDAGALRGATQIIDRPTVPEVAARESAATMITVAADAPGWSGRGPGVYALRANTDGLSSRSVVVLRDPTAVPATQPIGVLVPITAGPRSEGLLRADELLELTGEGGRLSALLDGVSGTAAILAVDPSVVASIRALGSDAPPSAREWMLRLDALPNSRFALQFGDADVAVQAAAGLAEPLGPATLDYALDPEAFAVADEDDEISGLATTPTTPSVPTSAPEAALPTTADLLAVGGATPDVFWPALGAASDEVLRTIASWSADEPGALASTVVGSSVGFGREALQAPATAGGLRVLVYEEPASNALRDAARAGDAPRAGPLAALSAHIALTTAAAGGPLLITTGRLDDVTGTALQAAISTALGYPGVAPATLTDLLAAGPVPLEADAVVDGDAVDALEGLLAAEERVDAYSAMIDDPALMTAPERTAILQLIGASWALDPVAWAAALDAHAETTAALLTSVSIPQPSTIQLITPEAPLRFYVQNDLPWAVNLDLVAVPDNLRLEVERVTPVRAEPGTNTTVQVPVRARVGNGEVLIELGLISPTGQQIGPTRYADVQVRADWEGIGVIVLAALIGLLLIAGLARTVLRRRRARRPPARVVQDDGADGADAGGPARE